MSGDEVATLILSAIVALVSWTAFYIGPTFVIHVGRRPAGSRLLRLAPILAAALLWVVLRNASSLDVRDDPRYLTFYLVLGAAWVGVWIRFLAITGISMRDDVVERSNGSASIAITGAMLGITLCYAGGNIGNGPGWWVVVFSAGLACVARARGVSDVLLIHAGKSVQEDLAHVLLRWQQGGLRLLQASPSDSSTSELTVTRPSWFRQAWYRALAASRLRRNNAGGFGAVIPV
jgi:hypothetical protein